MFKMVEQRKVWWPVVWDAPVDFGKTQSVKIEMRFVLIGPDDAEAIVQAALALDNEEGSDRPMSDRKAEALKDLIDDWKGVGDDEGNAVAFDADALARFFRMPGTFMPVLNSYVACANGKPEARRKN